MQEFTIGIIIIIISALGYVSNWLNWHFLNYKINHLLYYFGAFIHESSHALLALLMGAKIHKYTVISIQPQVTYSNPKVPILGNLLISIAPILGGIGFLFLVNKFFLANQFIMPAFTNWKFFLNDFFKFLSHVNLTLWKDWVLIFLLLNMGAMIGPSVQDLKNVWVLIILLVFIPWQFFNHLGMLAVTFVLMNIIIQVCLVIIISLVQLVW
ncbi:MAG: hypothetical protein P4L63_01335 [Candidatus Pacebacteria bacterium]|nr:hypothetical protein [Candidatus Paceibacterota bacterium]